MDAYYVDAAGTHTGWSRRTAASGRIADTSRDGRLALLSRLVSRGSNDLYPRLHATRASEILLTPHEGPGQFFGVLTPDGSTVYLGTNKTTDHLALGRVKVAARAGPRIEVLLAREDAELDDVEMDDQGRQLALAWNVGRPLRALPLRHRHRQGAPPRQPPERDRRPAPPSHPTGGSLAVVASGAGAPTDIWILDIASGAVPAAHAQPTCRHRPRLARPPRARPLRRARRAGPHRLAVSRARGRPAPARSSWTTTAGRKARRARSSTARTRPCCSAASPCSRPTCAARRASARSSSTSTTGRCAPTACATSSPPSTTS